MMPYLEIVKSGLMTSIQDLGRPGLAYYAIPGSGVMDTRAAKIALLLLGLPEAHPLIECTSLAPHIRFHAATRVTLTGADFNWKVNQMVVPRNTIIEIQEGDLLHGRFGKEGLRGYIAIDEKLKVQKVYDSYSTYTNAKIGGFQGRLLQKGDQIEWASSDEDSAGTSIIPIHAGPEFHLLTETSRRSLSSQRYTVHPDSNRMGLRLGGIPLESTTYQLKESLPVLPGFIQLPPSGLPIIVLQDGQTTGGYPRIAYVPEHFLSVLNQIPLGGRLRMKLK